MSKITEVLDMIEPACTVGEKFLNIPGSIPIVSSISGPVRIAAGQLQAGIGALMTIGGVVAYLTAELEADQAEYRADTTRSAEFAMHGVANIIRGAVESIPLLNLLTIIYDGTHSRFEYRVEQKLVQLET